MPPDSLDLLGEHDGPKFDKFEGRLAQVLPPKRPIAQEREQALAMPAAIGITAEQLRAVLPERDEQQAIKWLERWL